MGSNTGMDIIENGKFTDKAMIFIIFTRLCLSFYPEQRKPLNYLSEHFSELMTCDFGYKRFKYLFKQSENQEILKLFRPNPSYIQTFTKSIGTINKRASEIIINSVDMIQGQKNTTELVSRMTLNNSNITSANNIYRVFSFLSSSAAKLFPEWRNDLQSFNELAKESILDFKHLYVIRPEEWTKQRLCIESNTHRFFDLKNANVLYCPLLDFDTSSEHIKSSTEIKSEIKKKLHIYNKMKKIMDLVCHANSALLDTDTFSALRMYCLFKSMV